MEDKQNDSMHESSCLKNGEPVESIAQNINKHGVSQVRCSGRKRSSVRYSKSGIIRIGDEEANHSKRSPQPLPSIHVGTEIERDKDLVHRCSSNKKTVSELESKTNNDKPIPEKVVTNENSTKKQSRVTGENTSAGLKTKGAFTNTDEIVSVHVSLETENGPEMSLDIDVKEEVLGGENDAHGSSPHIVEMEDLASDVHGEAMSRDTEMVKEEVLEDEYETHDSSPHDDQMEDSSTDENDESNLPISFENANMALKKLELRKCTEQLLKAAAMYVKEGKSSIAVAARMFGVPRTTLSARLRGRKAQIEATYTMLTLAEETKIVSWFNEASQRGCPPTRQHMLATVRAMLQNNNRKTPFKKDGPGKTWYKLFLKRHPEVCLSPEEKKAKFTQEKHRRWFTNALREINLIDADVLNHPERIFSCHESIFQFNGVIAKSLTKDRHKRVNAMNTFKRATVLAGGNASGEVLQPLMAFTSTLGNPDLSEGFSEALCATSPNGLINTNIFKRWLEKAFIPAIRDLARPVLLFIDGHKIHCNMTVSEVCKDHGVILYQVPSKFIHPMNLTTFSALCQSWREEVLNFRNDTGEAVMKKDFAKVFRKAWKCGMDKTHVVSRFSEAGLYPWNRNTDIIDITEFQQSDGMDEREETVLPEETSDDQGQSDEKQADGKPSDGHFSVDKQGLSISNRPSASLLQFTSANQFALPFHSDDQSLNRDNSMPLGPFPSCNSVTSPLTTTADNESSAMPPLCSPLHPTSAVSDFNDYHYFKSTAAAPRKISNAQALDKLLSIAATIGSCKLTAFLTTFEYNRNYELPDPLFGPFCDLYNRLANLATASDQHEDVIAGGESSFGTVPISTLAISQLFKRGKQATAKAKSLLKSNLSSVECTTFVKEQNKTNEANKKKRKARETEDKAIIKYKIKKRKESESEEKKGQQIQNCDDMGKAVIFENKTVKETMKRQNKVRDPCLELGQLSEKTIVIDAGGSDEDTAVTELLDTDICVGCMGKKDDETNEWIGCECGRWYHVGCADDIRLLGKSMKEIRNLVFTCSVCRKRKK